MTWYFMKRAFLTIEFSLDNFKNIRIDTQCYTEIEEFFNVIRNVAFAHDQEFTRNIVDATFFIQLQYKLYNIDFCGMTDISWPFNLF